MNRRRTVWGASVVGVVATAATALAAGPIAVQPKAVHVSQGAISILRTSIDSGDTDYDVALTGPLAVHGWSHTGTLHGTVRAQLWQAFWDEIPNFDVATDDGVVTGACGGAPDSTLADVTGSDPEAIVNRVRWDFDCDLSYEGSARWHITFTAETKQKNLDPTTQQFTGTYRLIDAETSAVSINRNVTYGDIQLSSYSDDGGGQILGPLHLSGQIVIGAGRYVGDIVSDPGPYAASSTFTDLPVSGNNGGHSVSGACSGDTSAGDITCELSLDSGPVVTVPLAPNYTGNDGRCYLRQCWGTQYGYFTSPV